LIVVGVSGLANRVFTAHSSNMTKKRGSVWKGIRDAFNLHEALEMLGTFGKSGERALEELINVVLMLLALSAVLGFVYFFG